MSSVKFDSTEILDSTHIPRFVQHEDTADRNLMEVSLARTDGDILIAEWYRTKVIRLQGTLVGSSQSDLESKIDTFKELFSRPEKNLDISWAGGTRRYIATCSKHQFTRDYFNINVVPWTAEFTVSTGVGYDTSTSTPISAEAITTADDGSGNFIYEDSFVIDGSKPAAPIITLEFGTCDADMLGIEFLNTDTNERIIVTKNASWTDATVVIDCFNKRVLHNLDDTSVDPSEGNFYGLFPSFKVGTNNFRITTGGIVNQKSSDDSIPAGGPFLDFSDSVSRHAESFQIPYTDDTFGAFKLGLKKTGTPAGFLSCTIVSDDDGSPSVSTVFSANISESDVTLSPSYVLSSFPSALTLDANTVYWFEMYPTSAGTMSDFYTLYATSQITYPRGHAAHSSDSGSTWDTGDTDVPSFRVLFGGLGKATDITLTVEYTTTYL